MEKVFIVLHADGAMTIWGKRQRKSVHAEGAALYAADESVRMIELLEWIARNYAVRWTEGAIAPTSWKPEAGG